MEETQATKPLSLDEPEAFQILARQIANKPATKELRPPQEIILLGESGLRRLELLSNQISFILGRFSSGSSYGNQIDLSDFGGQELGVSRLHAQIQRDGQNIYLTDLESRNGTFLYGTRLEAKRATLIDSGAYVSFGRLHLQIVFKLHA